MSVLVDDIKLDVRKPNMPLLWKKLLKNADIDESTAYLDHVYLGCTQRVCQPI